ncbi:ATP/GTP-binding protein [Streptomyces sp. NBRC 13847]|uniref:zeta toxin family protein n=1 Tax=Streptomyces TaxID=1883 RepID=UPI0024A56A3F|nr:zeta toxin family protein [Streptomyces sp. NBRC 13847]GLW19829.1 ATP/GTP-binding protein [Streptomyces sp. NBRC 13847]
MRWWKPRWSDPEQARAYRAAGYRVELVALATAQAVTQLSVLDRYLETGRYISWDNLDECARRLRESVETIEAEQLAHRVMVVRRDLDVLYDNALTEEGHWRAPAGAHQALVAEWARPWTAPETWRFRRQVSGVQEQLHPAVTTAQRRLAVAGGLERACALAEPVRRIAQPLTAAPGVDYHRLSADEHAFVFDELIVPSYLSHITAQDEPVVLYMMDAQGAGKTRTSRMLRRALHRRRPTRIEGGMFRAMHPDYRRLLQEQPRTASARIRADYRAWQEQAEAYVRARRGDLLIEIAPDSVGHLIDSARRHHRAGYRVELIVLATRAADSRLGTAARCAEVARLGGSPRFTSAAGHDATFRVLADALRAAEGEPRIVDSVSVIRRDLSAVYRNERTPDGTWVRPPRGGEVLETAQQLPYTPAEAGQFLATLQRVQGELPQYRSDLVEIAALARPLMPPHLQPRTLASTRTSAPLPLPHHRSGYWPPSSLARAAISATSSGPASSSASRSAAHATNCSFRIFKRSWSGAAARRSMTICSAHQALTSSTSFSAASGVTCSDKTGCPSESEPGMPAPFSPAGTWPDRTRDTARDRAAGARTHRLIPLMFFLRGCRGAGSTDAVRHE